jgi:hypothetical protein
MITANYKMARVNQEILRCKKAYVTALHIQAILILTCNTRVNRTLYVLNLSSTTCQLGPVKRICLPGDQYTARNAVSAC